MLTAAGIVRNDEILLEQLARRPDRSFDLPQRTAAIVAECVERANLRERGQFIPSHAGLRDQILDGGETGPRCPVVRSSGRPTVRGSGLGARGSGLGCGWLDAAGHV